MTNKTAFDEIRKAQEIILDAIDRTARTNLASAEKLLELNRKRFSGAEDFSNPADLVSRQAGAFKKYAEELNHQFEELATIGNESREQLTELGQEFAKNLDFTSFFNFAQPETRAQASKSKSTAKAG
ncbi:MAG: phasin family protein [Wenzhouxiangellaceae bacterium]|nr:phasin family protein [Wenzhouxiangellaceae bacterium]